MTYTYLGARRRAGRPEAVLALNGRAPQRAGSETLARWQRGTPSWT